MKRIYGTDGWISCKRSKQEDKYEAPKDGVGAVLHVDHKKVFVPEWILKQSEVMDHILEEEEDDVVDYPVPNIGGVTANSIKDCVMLYTLSKDLIVNKNVNWKYHSTNTQMDKILKTVYRWRTRLGYLISTAGYFGWKVLQVLGDTVMKHRTETSYSNGVKAILFGGYKDERKNNELLDFFVGKLKYDKIHFEMMTVWITQELLNEWVSKMIFFHKTIRRVNYNMKYLMDNLNFKPLFWNSVSFSWNRN